jgi:hypothetical protein
MEVTFVADDFIGRTATNLQIIFHLSIVLCYRESASGFL